MRRSTLRGSIAFVAFAGFATAAPAFRVATPSYHFQFPRDHFNHPDFRTEWWYYTGNVRAASGRRYGFELVFFRQGEHRRPAENPSTWRADDLYLAHLALTDIDGKRFRYYERLNRAGPGIAGVSLEEGRIWNGNWQSRWDLGSGTQTLTAVAADIRFQLRLTARKPPVINGENGISQKADGAGQASYYVSFPRLAVEGTLNGAAVTGSAWMDHEWFTSQLAKNQVGWDWFSIQLDNGADLMLFRLRRADGSIDPHSAGTYIDPAGRATHLKQSDFTLAPLDLWRSPHTHARYPVRWHIAVPAWNLSLEARAALPDQELPAENGIGNTYWEGSVQYSGSATGVGYLEMTGYAKPVQF
ncbi:MAG TPA: lipocalin-like domain-containing protein [Bryobacteraceae bacterium]|nr:lipocalin-like domain-containing protein [Bryobacteraceae bacterium]